jgi:hypothetical protein
MPIQLKYTISIPKIYKRKYEDIGMLFYVEGMIRAVPTCSVKQALYLYFELIKAEDFNIDTAIVTISQLRAELIEKNYHAITEKTCSHT